MNPLHGPFHDFPLRLLCGGMLLANLLGAAGCAQPTGQVTGIINFEGAPVVRAEIVFRAETDSNQVFAGLSDAHGTYRVSYRGANGMPTGRYQIAIKRFSLADGKPLPGDEKGDALKSEGRVTEQVFHFEKDILSGLNTVNFELKEGKPVDPLPRKI